MRKNRILLIIVICCLNIVQHTKALCQDGSNYNDVRLKIESQNKTVIPGEPIVLNISLINEGVEKITIKSTFGFHEGSLYLFIKPLLPQEINNQPIPFRPAYHVDKEASLIEIDKLQSYSRNYNFLYNDYTGNMIFEKAGKYQIYVDFYFSAGGKEKIKLHSNIVEITVNDPNEIDSKALVVWNNKYVGRGLQEDTARLEAINRMNLIIKEYPDSTYSKYAKMTIERLKRYVDDNPYSHYAKDKNIIEALYSSSDSAVGQLNENQPVEDSGISEEQDQGSYLILTVVIITIIIIGLVVLILFLQKSEKHNT